MAKKTKEERELEIKSKGITEGTVFYYRKFAIDNGYNYTKIRNLINEVFKGLGFKDKDSNKHYIYCANLLLLLENSKNKDIDAKTFFNNLKNEAVIIRNQIENNKITMEDAERIRGLEEQKLRLKAKRALIKDFEFAKVWDKNNLLRVEENQKKDSMEEYDKFKSPKARGSIIGAVNRGFYGDTKEDLDLIIKEECGRFDRKSRFIPYMNDDLLRMRMALMNYVSCSMNKLKNKYSSIANEDCIAYLMKIAGESARELYKDIYSLEPIDEIKNRIYFLNTGIKPSDGKQISMFDEKVKTR